MKMHLNMLCGALVIAFAGPVSATTWGLQGTPDPGVKSINAVSNSDGTSTASNAAAQKIEAAAWVSSYGGINNADNPGSGRSDIDLTEGSSPEHAIDNNQRYDMVLVGFDSLVHLTSLALSWYNYDSDFTVMAYTGSGKVDPNPFTNGDLIGKTFSNSMSGWTVVGSYGGPTTNGTAFSNSSNPSVRQITYQPANANLYSSYWLIGAYNPLVGGPVTGSPNMGTNSADNYSGYDYIKLKSVAGDVCPNTNPGCGSGGGNVSEPGSLALLGLGLLGMMRLRKARQA